MAEDDRLPEDGPDDLPARPRPRRTGPVARLFVLGSAVQRRLPRLVAALAGGGLLWASFPALSWWWAAFPAVAALTWVLIHPDTTPAGGLGYGFLFGLTFFVPLLPWIGSFVGPMPWLALSMACAAFLALFGLFAVVVRGLPGWPLWFAVLWTALEWLKSLGPFDGFPWGSVAFGQADGPLLSLVQLGGQPLLSFSVVLVATCLTAIGLEIVKYFRSKDPKDSEDSEDAKGKPPAVLLPGVSICLVLLAATVIWPQVRHAGIGSGDEPTLTVAVVQGNVPRLGFDFNAQRRAVLDNHVNETLRLAEDVRAGTAPQPLFVIWPENSSDIDPLANADAGRQISVAADAIGVPILIGTVLDVPGRPPEAPEYTNTMIVWNPGTGPGERHDKAIVQPFGEYMPMRGLFRLLSDFADRAGHFVPRPGTGTVRIAGVPIGVATCWEVVFDRAPRNSVLHGAQLLVVPSNNATFTKTMSEQQLAFAKVRAVEHDRYVLVAGTTGVSAVIAPDGHELVRTEFFTPDYLDAQVRLKTGLTLATRFAPILQWILAGTAGALILLGMRHNGWFPRPRRRRSGPADEPDIPPSAESDGLQTANDSAAANVETANDAPPSEGGRTDVGRHEGAT